MYAFWRNNYEGGLLEMSVMRLCEYVLYCTTPTVVWRHTWLMREGGNRERMSRFFFFIFVLVELCIPSLGFRKAKNWLFQKHFYLKLRKRFVLILDFSLQNWNQIASMYMDPGDLLKCIRIKWELWFTSCISHNKIEKLELILVNKFWVFVFSYMSSK